MPPPHSRCLVLLLLLHAAVLSQGGKLTCKDGKRLLCGCPDSLRESFPDLCADRRAQCERSICSPVCLRQAWHSRVFVDCSMLPSWQDCGEFQEQLSAAAEGIVGQFQAHVCSRLLRGCCDEEARVLQTFVDDATFGEDYPVSRLTVPMCRAAARSGRAEQDALCDACEAVSKVEVWASDADCVPEGASASQAQKRPLGVQERVRPSYKCLDCHYCLITYCIHVDDNGG